MFHSFGDHSAEHPGEEQRKMNTVPGFTAAAAIYKSHTSYRAFVTRSLTSQLVPQVNSGDCVNFFRICNLGCQSERDPRTCSAACEIGYLDCLSGVGGGGGGVGGGGGPKGSYCERDVDGICPSGWARIFCNGRGDCNYTGCCLISCSDCGPSGQRCCVRASAGAIPTCFTRPCTATFAFGSV